MKNNKTGKDIDRVYSIWFTRKQCSQLLNVGISKIDEWIDGGEGPLKSFKADGMRMVHRKDLIAFGKMMRSQGGVA